MEDKLDHELEQLLAKVEKFSEESMLQTEQDERFAIFLMWSIMASSIILGIAINRGQFKG